MEPLERVKLRRFIAFDYNDYDELEILIPEGKTYGTRHVGFFDAVMDWAEKVQKPYVDFNNPPKWDTVDFKGGSYQDVDSNDIWNNFFGTKERLEKR